MPTRTVYEVLDCLAADLEALRAALAPFAGTAMPASARRDVRAGRPGRQTRLAVATVRRAKTQPPPSRSTGNPASPRRSPATPGRRRHGLYLAAIVRLPKAQRLAAKKIRTEKGVEAAIAFAKSLKKR